MRWPLENIPTPNVTPVKNSVKRGDNRLPGYVISPLLLSEITFCIGCFTYLCASAVGVVCVEEYGLLGSECPLQYVSTPASECYLITSAT